MSAVREPSSTIAGPSRAQNFRGLCRWGAFAAFALLLYSFGMLAQAIVIGVGAPANTAAIFAMLHDHPVEGLLRLDLPTVFAIPLYYLLFLGLFAALHRVDLSSSIVSTSLAFVGTTLVVATPTALPMLRLSHLYFAAATEAQKAQYIAAGEAVMATDLWHHTGALVGAVLLQIGAVLICYVMLHGQVFSKATAWLGLIMHSLDLLHILFGNFVPLAATVLMSIAGALYPFWFILIGRRLWQLSVMQAVPQPVNPSATAG